MAAKSKVTSSRKPKVTASVEIPAMGASPVSSTSSGIRSAPAGNLWRSWRFETAAQARDRVQISRSLQEELPFIGYLNAQLPEEAIGDGLTPTSESKNAAFKRESTSYFDLWARSNAIDIRRRFDWYTSQHMVAQTVIGDGEAFVHRIRDTRPEALARPLSDKSFRALQLQFLTRDQLGNTGGREFVANGSDLYWDQGIQYDRLDIARSYRILKRTSGLLNAATEYEDKEAAKIMHIFADRCFNQRHGTPWLFRGSKSALDALDLKAVKKYAARIRAYFLGAITTPSGEAPASMKGSVRKGVKTNGAGETVDDGLRYIELAGGLSLPTLRKDESITFFQGQEPLTFAELLRELWNEIVMCYGYPPEYLINLSGLGSASVRMVLRKVAKAHGRIRRFVREQYCQPTWEFVIGDAIERGLSWTRNSDGSIVDDWRMVSWKGGIDPSIDAGRDERAEQDKLRTFTGTVEQYCDALGLNGEQVRHARLDEIADNIAYGAQKGLPWFMCIDAMQVQAMTGLATSLGVDIGELVAKLTTSDAASHKI